jgi:hypothetical protein
VVPAVTLFYTPVELKTFTTVPVLGTIYLLVLYSTWSGTVTRIVERYLLVIVLVLASTDSFVEGSGITYRIYATVQVL